MQKKLIALAIASAMTVPALAYAEANVSGQVNMSVDNYNDGAVTASASAWKLQSNNSRIILKGSEDLGDGMSAMYNFDMRVSVDTGTTSSTSGKLFDGNNYLGLKSNFGTVLMGRMDAPYKTSTRNLDVFFDVAGDNRSSNGSSIAGLLSHDRRFDNAIAYVSPGMSGFAIAAAAVFGGENPQPSSTKGAGYSLSGTWKMDAFYAALAFESIKYGSTNTGDLGPATATLGKQLDDTDDAFKIAGGWSADAFTLNAVVEMPSAKAGTIAVPGTKIETKNTNIYLAGKFAFSASDAVKLAYTDFGDQDVNGTKVGNHASQVAVGYDHSLSKATSVYANYVKTSADGTTAAAQADPSVLSLGVKHAF